MLALNLGLPCEVLVTWNLGSKDEWDRMVSSPRHQQPQKAQQAMAQVAVSRGLERSSLDQRALKRCYKGCHVNSVRPRGNRGQLDSANAEQWMCKVQMDSDKSETERENCDTRTAGVMIETQGAVADKSDGKGGSVVA